MPIHEHYLLFAQDSNGSTPFRCWITFGLVEVYHIINDRAKVHPQRTEMSVIDEKEKILKNGVIPNNDQYQHLS